MKKRIDVERLHDKFNRLVGRYMDLHEMTQQDLADYVGLERSHINALLNNKRKLSTYYIWQFLRGGIMGVRDIYDGQAESKAEEEFWSTAKEAENLSTLRVIGQLRKKGVDVDGVLQALLNNKGNG